MIFFFTSSCMQGLFYELPQTSSIFDLVEDVNSLKKLHHGKSVRPTWFIFPNLSFTDSSSLKSHTSTLRLSFKQTILKNHPNFLFYREEHKIRWYYIKSHFCQFFELVLPARHCWHPGRNPRSMLGSVSLACSWCCTWWRGLVMLKRKQKNIETRTT